jgi:putative endonuclease
MDFYVYILYSIQIDKHYIGYTSLSIEERLYKHIHSNKGFTARSKDWQVMYHEFYQTKQEALKREKEIKSWKSRVRIEKLIAGNKVHPD